MNTQMSFLKDYPILHQKESTSIFAPISTAPPRTTPVELKELKIQLEELAQVPLIGLYQEKGMEPSAFVVLISGSIVV